MIRTAYFAAGLFFVVLAFIGAALPVMPSTIFVILAAACFTHSSPRFEAWLLGHEVFGPSLQAWRKNGAILPKAKAMAVLGMAVGFGVFWYLTEPAPLLAGAIAAFFIASAWFVLSRPSGPGGD